MAASGRVNRAGHRPAEHLIPVVLFYLWESGKLRQHYKAFIFSAMLPLAIFVLVRVFIPADHAAIGLHGILPYYWMKFNESIGNALTAQAWFRRLVWCSLPLTMVPIIYFDTTRSFFSSRKYLAFFFVLVVITNLWGIDPGGGDAERQMAPSFLAFYWLIAVIVQQELSREKWLLTLLLSGAYLTSFHHAQGLLPLPNKWVTLSFTLAGFFLVTIPVLICRNGRRWKISTAA